MVIKNSSPSQLCWSWMHINIAENQGDACTRLCFYRPPHSALRCQNSCTCVTFAVQECQVLPDTLFWRCPRPCVTWTVQKCQVLPSNVRNLHEEAYAGRFKTAPHDDSEAAALFFFACDLPCTKTFHQDVALNCSRRATVIFDSWFFWLSKKLAALFSSASVEFLRGICSATSCLLNQFSVSTKFCSHRVCCMFSFSINLRRSEVNFPCLHSFFWFISHFANFFSCGSDDSRFGFPLSFFHACTSSYITAQMLGARPRIAYRPETITDHPSRENKSLCMAWPTGHSCGSTHLFFWYKFVCTHSPNALSSGFFACRLGYTGKATKSPGWSFNHVSSSSNLRSHGCCLTLRRRYRYAFMYSVENRGLRRQARVYSVSTMLSGTSCQHPPSRLQTVSLGTRSQFPLSRHRSSRGVTLVPQPQGSGFLTKIRYTDFFNAKKWNNLASILCMRKQWL